MIRELTYTDRCSIYDAASALRGAEHALILALRSPYVSNAQSSIRTARADIDAALKLLDAAEAQLSNKPAPVIESAPASAAIPRLVPRFEPAPEPTSGGAA